ncbi:unnamed protein product [Auanema sp. JU1783]|nr:unnamed protein product [Auanema sp. JU1783]
MKINAQSHLPTTSRVKARDLQQKVLEIERYDYHSEKFKDIWDIRLKVFVEEQGVPEDEELDAYEESSEHFLCFDPEENKNVGVFRLNVKEPFVKLERVAILKECRGKRFGAVITNWLLKYCKNKWPNLLVVAHAQSSVLPFYGKLGAIVVSDEYLDEVNILHRTVIFPDLTYISQYDVRQYDENLSTCVYKGEYNDPNVIKNIKSLLHDIQENRFITLGTLIELCDSRIIGLGLFNKFVKYATWIIEQQSRTNVFKDLFVPSYPLEQLIKDETFLIHMAWKELNTGHYSNVDERWRYFYFGVLLAKTVRLRNEHNYKEALNAFDMAILMGRHKFDDCFILNITNDLKNSLERLPIVDCHLKNIQPPISLEHSKNISIQQHDLSDEAFYEQYGLPNLPVHIRNLVQSWPAFTKWNFEYLNDVMGHRLVPIEIGTKYTEDGWSQKIISANEFFGKCNESSGDEGIHYLAQHRLLDQIVELKADITTPSLCTVTGASEEDTEKNLWIGPQGTVSPLHTDPRHNLFCQVYGRKFLRLIPPTDTEHVYPIQDGILTNTSQVDVEHPDYEEFPNFAKAQCFDVILEAGDALYIPKKWWHFVKSLSPSISVSCWFDLELED